MPRTRVIPCDYTENQLRVVEADSGDISVSVLTKNSVGMAMSFDGVTICGGSNSGTQSPGVANTLRKLLDPPAESEGTFNGVPLSKAAMDLVMSERQARVDAEKKLAQLREILNQTHRTYHWLHPNQAHPIRYPQLSDKELASEVRMLTGRELEHEHVVCAARDRIMHLSELVDEARTCLSQIGNGVTNPPTCEHDWLDVSNKVVDGVQMCTKCHATRPENPSRPAPR